jgi:hypothetical protein
VTRATLSSANWPTSVRAASANAPLCHTLTPTSATLVAAMQATASAITSVLIPRAGPRCLGRRQRPCTAFGRSQRQPSRNRGQKRP